MGYDILQLKILLIFTVRDRSKLSLIILVSHNRMTQPENRPSLNTEERSILSQTQEDAYTLTKRRVWVPTMTRTRTQRPQILERMAMGYEPLAILKSCLNLKRAEHRIMTCATKHKLKWNNETQRYCFHFADKSVTFVRWMDLLLVMQEFKILA